MDKWDVDLTKENVLWDVGDMVVCLLLVRDTYSLSFEAAKSRGR